MTQNTSSRQLKAAQLVRILSTAVIVGMGATRLKMVGRGNQYIRDNGTAVHIFNVNAFADSEDLAYAKEQFQAGYALEKQGKLDAAQEHYRNALNTQMSFSVLKENAPAFQEAFEVNVLVETVKNSKGEDVIALNSPRPVAITKADNTAAAEAFKLDELPAQQPSAISTSRSRAKKVA